VSSLPLALRLRSAGERQAIRRAGPWPVHGTLEAYTLATDRAVREARRTQDIEIRWNMRFRLWEPPQRDDPVVAHHTARLAARRHKAIEIAEDREWLLRKLTAAPGGSA
jgi:hypothetical protein